MLHVLTRDQMLVHVLLNLGEIAANHLDKFGRQMLCIQGIDSPQNEFIDGSTHIVLDFHHFSLLRIGGIWFATSKNGKKHVATEFLLRP